MVDLMEPIFRNRTIGLINLAFTNSQRNPTCKNFEYRYADCIEAYGYYKGQDKCQFLMEDLAECLYMTKQRIRVNMMTEERKRQMKEGKRDFIPYPRPDLL
ncbi:NADH dehydrogenase (ubiquinone) 15 kDa subunit [Colletes latitarsis]|uniref:NADH dehydrogenase (ubiquinone) 15 kDa subunit n=1 Tax=Colletes latitarsis TaxID=2605962 RepID=UPI00403512E9